VANQNLLSDCHGLFLLAVQRPCTVWKILSAWRGWVHDVARGKLRNMPTCCQHLCSLGGGRRGTGSEGECGKWRL